MSLGSALYDLNYFPFENIKMHEMSTILDKNAEKKCFFSLVINYAEYKDCIR